MNICIIGAGYVGLVSAACFAEFGVNVVCVDKDEERVQRLARGESPIFEPGLAETMGRGLKSGRLSFTTDLAAGVEQSLVIFLAVGTPSLPSGEVDLSAVREASAQIGRCMNGYKVVVNKSTVPVGASRMVEEIIREAQTEPHEFDVVSNPEFLREGAGIEDFTHPNRVVLGARREQALAIMRDLYRPLYLIETPFVITSNETAELIKHASNAFLATKISFINEMANLCELVGADVHHVAKAMGLDKRIGRLFLHPGPGYGGSCFPKDTRSLAFSARALGYDFKIVEAVIQVNDQQRERMVGKIEGALGSLAGKKIACLGLTFKPNTDDIRDSAAVYIVAQLARAGARVHAFDPQGMDNAASVLGGVEFAADAYQAMEGAQALIIATEWNEFRNLNMDQVKHLMAGNFFFDLKNIYEPARMRGLGFEYFGVGR